MDNHINLSNFAGSFLVFEDLALVRIRFVKLLIVTHFLRRLEPVSNAFKWYMVNFIKYSHQGFSVSINNNSKACF